MPVTVPPITQEQKQELDSIMGNEQLLEFMEANLPNQGDTESDGDILEQQAKAVEAFSKNSPERFLGRWEN